MENLLTRPGANWTRIELVQCTATMPLRNVPKANYARGRWHFKMKSCCVVGPCPGAPACSPYFIVDVSGWGNRKPSKAHWARESTSGVGYIVKAPNRSTLYMYVHCHTLHTRPPCTCHRRADVLQTGRRHTIDFEHSRPSRAKNRDMFWGRCPRHEVRLPTASDADSGDGRQNGNATPHS